MRQLDWQIEQLPAEQRRRVRLWLALAEQKRRGEAGGVLPNAADIRYLAMISSGNKSVRDNRKVRERCIACGWVRRDSLSFVLTRKGRTALDLAQARQHA